MPAGSHHTSLFGTLKIDPEVLAGLSEAERERVAGELLVLEEAFKQNPLLGYEPHGKQVVFHSPEPGDWWPPLRAFFGGNRCLAAGTLVRMADGSEKPIERIEPGEMVLGSNELGVCRAVRVLHRFENGPKPCHRFRFGKRGTQAEVIATFDHRVSAMHEKGFRAVLPLGAMDGLTRSRWSVQRVTHYVASGFREPSALLFGMLLGDGCTVNGRVSFACDDEDVRRLLDAECAAIGITARQNPANPIQYYLSVGHTGGKPNPLRARLEELGMACYAHEKRLPDMSEWGDESVARLLVGLLITDGSVWKASEGWRLGFTSVSKGLVEDVKREIEQRYGVYGSTLLTQDRTHQGKRIEYSLTIGNYWALARLSSALPVVAKLRKLADAVRGWEGKRSDGARLRYRGFDQVGMRPTFDLHVDHPDHLFVLANGIIVHNSGKTTAAMVDTLIQAVDADVVPEPLRRYKRWEPPFKCRVITPDFGDSHEVVLEKIREWCPKGQLKGGSFDRAFDKVKRVLWFKNGSRLHFNSNVQEREQLGGSDLHRVVYDEEPRRDLRTESLTRLIDHAGEEIFAMTPFSGMSWLYDDIYEPWEMGRLGPKDGRVVVVDMDDNPHLSPDGKRRALSQYSATEREARKSGRFVHFAGLIYPEFSWNTHSLPELQVPENKAEAAVPKGVEVFAGIDPGLRHPAVVFCYLDFEDRLVVFDEILMEGTIEKVCAEIRRREAVWRIRPRWYVIDPAVRNKNAQTGKSDQDEFIKQGIVAMPGQNDVRLGINNVKQRLEADPPRLLVTANCQEIRGEFARYRWSSPKRQTEDERREKPVKRSDHLLDALRYVVMFRPLKPAQDLPRDSDTLKDRLLRHHLRRLKPGRPMPDTGFGPGQWA